MFLFPEQITATWIISQILSFASFGFILWSFQLSSREKLLRCMLLGALLNGLHFFVLEKFAAGTEILIIMVAIIVAQQDRRNDALWITAFISAFLLVTILAFNGLPSILSLIASITGVVGLLQRNEKRMRLILFSSTIGWIFHNAIIQSPMAAFKEACIFISSLTGYFRRFGYFQKQKLEKL